MRMMMVVAVTVYPRVAPARAEDRDADRDDEQPRREVQPRVELIGHDELRQREGHEAERKDAGGVRRGDDQPEQRRMPRRATAADEVRGDDRLAVAGRERMRGSPEQRGRERRQDDPEAE